MSIDKEFTERKQHYQLNDMEADLIDLIRGVDPEGREFCDKGFSLTVCTDREQWRMRFEDFDSGVVMGDLANPGADTFELASPVTDFRTLDLERLAKGEA